MTTPDPTVPAEISRALLDAVGVWCADEIGDFRDGVYTLADLHAAIGEHIAKRRQFEEENSD